MIKKTDFIYSAGANPHHIRIKEILKEHPEVRDLIGKNPNSIFAIIGLVLFQIVMAWLLRDQSWWLVFAAAYLLGAFADHSLFVMIHECGHQLLFKSRAANRWAGIIANLPQIFPNSISFERYHAKHHSAQGIHDMDADLPNKWEAKLINNYFLGKALWLLLFPFFQLFRLPRLKEIQKFDSWSAANYLVQIVFVAAILYFMGWHAMGFLLLSFSFSIGLHPLGARWIQEHYLTYSSQQETYSYYGHLNTVSFNIGFHNEHHDFPSIPWNKLPQLKKAAPKYYDSLLYHKSLTILFFRFLFDREISLYNRIVRKEKIKPILTES